VRRPCGRVVADELGSAIDELGPRATGVVGSVGGQAALTRKEDGCVLAHTLTFTASGL